MKTWIRFVILLLGLSFAVPALAQENQPRRGKQAERDERQKKKSARAKKQQIQQRLRELRKRVLRQNVGLDEKKAERVERILDESAPKRKKLKKHVHHHQQIVMHLLQADSDDERAYVSALTEIRRAQVKMHELEQQEFEALSKQLNPKQLARLMVALHQMKKKVRARMREQRQRRPRKARDLGF